MFRTIQLGSICTLPATDACGELPQFRSMKVPVPIVHLMSPTSKQHSPNNAPVWSDTWTVRREQISPCQLWKIIFEYLHWSITCLSQFPIHICRYMYMYKKRKTKYFIDWSNIMINHNFPVK